MLNPQKTDIKSLSLEELTSMMKNFNQPQFRVKQVVQWLYGKGARSFDEMSNLSLALRNTLKENFSLSFPELVQKQISKDGTRKYLLKLEDDVTVETVGMPNENNTKLSVCISTQAGCRVRCAFCATGQNGFTRNLSIGEIVDQVRVAGEDFGIRPSSVVVMGQGEGFLNYDNMMSALRFINSEDGLGIGARHITISTAGMIVGIDKLAQEPEQFTLAISLHSAIQETRDQLMPGVAGFNLTRLKASIDNYIAQTSRRPSYEYALIKGLNDSDKHLDALVSYTEGTLAHVNLIELNEIDESDFKPASHARALEFKRRLERAGVECTIRNSRGSDIDAACGQLKQRYEQDN
ncbi:MAG: 23S rRNA (adenine(2503)-C(2))-methyltransferase RlmN [Coriobacteriia bacterium]|nr:23S rRNA (adenine(2503)-C(2))-methyltransferase RlmN [Coriobacteriia bacterium]